MQTLLASNVEQMMPPAIQEGQKICTKCRELLPVTRFGSHPTTKSGLQSWCKVCVNRNSASWHQRNKAKCQQRKRAWYKANPEALAAEKRRYYERHRDSIRAYIRSWYRANAQYARAFTKAKRQARQEGRPNHFLRFLVQLADAKTCPQCRRLKSLLEFDRDGRSVDGYSKRCLGCLPPRKTPPGGFVVELDKQRFDTAKAPTRHEAVADTSAVDPEEAAVQSALWGFVDALPDDQQRFILAFMESLDMEAAANDCGITCEEGTALLALVRTTATSTFAEDGEE